MLTGPPPKFHGTRDILRQVDDWISTIPACSPVQRQLMRDGSVSVHP